MDIESGRSKEPLLGNGSSDIIKPRGCMRATTIVGEIVNIVRLVVSLGLLAVTIGVALIASGVIPPESIKGPSTVFSIIVAIGCVMVFFDASTAQFLVKVVLSRLSREVDRLRGIAYDLRATEKRLKIEVVQLDDTNKQLEGTAHQFELVAQQKEKQLVVSQKQIDEQASLITDLEVVQANAQALLQSLMTYGNKTENFDKILTEHVDNLGDTAKIMQALTEKMTSQHFERMDTDGDGAITTDEFNQWIKEKTMN